MHDSKLIEILRGLQKDDFNKLPHFIPFALIEDKASVAITDVVQLFTHLQSFYPNFDHSDLENIRNLMRTNAIANAKLRAIALTKPLNQTVGQAIHIVDAENYSQQLQGRAAGIQIRGATTIQNDNYKELPKIDFEKIKVIANINAKFMLK